MAQIYVHNTIFTTQYINFNVVFRLLYKTKRNPPSENRVKSCEKRDKNPPMRPHGPPRTSAAKPCPLRIPRKKEPACKIRAGGGRKKPPTVRSAAPEKGFEADIKLHTDTTVSECGGVRAYLLGVVQRWVSVQRICKVLSPACMRKSPFSSTQRPSSPTKARSEALILSATVRV